MQVLLDTHKTLAQHHEQGADFVHLGSVVRRAFPWGFWLCFRLLAVLVRCVLDLFGYARRMARGRSRAQLVARSDWQRTQ